MGAGASAEGERGRDIAIAPFAWTGTALLEDASTERWETAILTSRWWADNERGIGVSGKSRPWLRAVMARPVGLLLVALACFVIGFSPTAGARSGRAPLRVSVTVTGQKLAVRITTQPGSRCTLRVSVGHRFASFPAVIATRKGRAAISWTVPSDAPSGSWAFAVRCKKAGRAHTVKRKLLLINHGGGGGQVKTPDSVRVPEGLLGGKGAGACPSAAAPDQNGHCVSFPGDPFNYYQSGTDIGQCTWYAAGRRPDLWGITTGDAKQWLAQASGRRPEGTAPVVGAVAVRTAGTWGHVAYVVGVTSNGTPVVDDANYMNDLTVRYSHSVPSGYFQGYIYGGPAGSGSAGSGPSGGGPPGTGHNSGSGVLASGLGMSAWRVAGDFTGDGKADLLYQDPGSTNLYLLSSTGSAFTSSLWVSGVGQAAWQQAGDVNGDGKADLIYQDPNSTVISVIYGGGGGRFSGSGVLASGLGMSAWRVAGDFTGDGKADLLYQDPGSTNLYLLSSTGSAFTSSLWVSGVGQAAWQQAGDVNGDGKADLIYQDPNSTVISVIYGGGGGRFSGSGVLASGLGMSAWRVAGDFTGDGKADLLYQDPGSTNLYLLSSTGSAFTSSLWVSGVGQAAWQQAGDVNGDGKADLIYQDPNSTVIRVIYGG